LRLNIPTIVGFPAQNESQFKMTLTLAVEGMTCSKCRAKVEGALAALSPGASVTLDPPQAIFTGGVDIAAANAALAGLGKYRLSQPAATAPGAQTKSWLATYFPLLLIAIFVSVASFAGTAGNPMVFHNWMINFMAGFFLVFSFFKLLDVRGFADAYSGYDLVAMQWKPWGLIYPFVELGLGLAYLFRFNLVATNWIALIVMTVSILGVIRSNLRKETIRCACLGTVLNLPMSTVTIVENGLMIAMAAMMIPMMPMMQAM
jgi:copper chaperone CopZ